MDHPELPLRKVAENLGVSESALKNWMKAAKEHEGSVPTRGSGNYASDEAKEIARLQRELRDTKDALEWKKRVPSDMSVRRTVLKEKIQKIYEDSHQNYGAPKITAQLRKSGECISEKTVGNYMRQMGIIISWVLSETLEAPHVVECIEKAKCVRNVEKPLIFHCDRGCQLYQKPFKKQRKE